MRSAILIFLAALAFAPLPARAQSASLERSMVRAVCSRQATPAACECLARRLDTLRAIDLAGAEAAPAYPEGLPLDEFHQQLTLQLGLDIGAARLAWCDASMRRIKARLARRENPHAHVP